MSASLLREASERIREDVAAGKCREPWHPAVALAVADWLDGCAIEITARLKRVQRNVPKVLLEDIVAPSDALAVAHAYLGDQS